ncbi:FAD-binding oxidoreductase [Rhizobium sp. L1K21]|uniref:FAD-binding oxidoreductase n=1 Tax=Rhizobium sp. L1K21 TaxID=2954933 RepID=UPI002093B555|nr:FAD-binding oxidoreductase [Rhizobium sp. L1K21]MCO6188448.1 FAD-binding oxidoreductase [Rhizobium sp. L1K21]
MTGLPSGIKADRSLETRNAFAVDRDTAGSIVPQAVLYPSRFEDVRKIVAWANETATPLVPVSSTGERRRGDTVPMVEAAVMVDLSGMRRLINADTRDKIAIIEPGVDFGSIDELLRPHGLRAFRPLMPRSGKSVIASYLDREPIVNADVHWDPADPFGGTLIVTGGGEITLNGSAALEGSLTEQLDRGHRHLVTYGPGNVDLTRVLQGAQGTLGIMGWAAIYCERLPQVEESIFVASSNLATVVAAMRDAVHQRICTTAFVVDNIHLAMLLGLNVDQANTLPAWTFFATHAGYVHSPEQKVAWQRAALEVIAKKHGADLCHELGGKSADDLAVTLRDPVPANYRDVEFGAHKELFFLHPLSTAKEIIAAQQKHLSSSDLHNCPVGTYIQPLAQGTFLHVERVMPHAAGDDVDAEWTSLAQISLDAGAYYSRPHGVFRQLAFSRDDGSARRMIAAAKTMLDPNNIMNPNRFDAQEAR